MKKNVIIYVGGFELPDKNAAAQRVLANGKIFRELNYRVVFVGVDKTLSQDVHINDTRAIVSGFDTWSIPYPASKKAWLKYITSNDHLEYIVEHYYKSDLYGVVCYNYPFVAQYKIKIMCLKRNALYIADATEWYESSGGGALFAGIKWLDTSLRMRFIHLQANGIITTSKYLSRFYNNRNCITVELPTLYDVDCLGEVSLERNKDKNIIKLMYAGSAFNLDRVNKNRTNIKDRLDKVILLLDEVSKQKSNFILNVYGLTRENYLLVFPEHELILCRLSRNVIFHGRKPHVEIIDNIKKSDFTIFLRNVDRVVEAGFPSKFSESISCGTPVIANMISNIENYIVEGKNCWVLSLEDSKEQSKKMLEILSLDNKEIVQMKLFCLESAIFSYKKYVVPVKDFFFDMERGRGNHSK